MNCKQCDSDSGNRIGNPQHQQEKACESPQTQSRGKTEQDHHEIGKRGPDQEQERCTERPHHTERGKLSELIADQVIVCQLIKVAMVCPQADRENDRTDRQKKETV